jgi:hypothetical protein
MKRNTYVCPHHPGLGALSGACPDCMEAWAKRRDPDTMTGDERAAEIDFWTGIVTIPFADIHQRINELVGRGVFTHEMGSKELLEEARTRVHPTPQEIINAIPSNKRIIVITDDEGTL